MSTSLRRLPVSGIDWLRYRWSMVINRMPYSELPLVVVLWSASIAVALIGTLWPQLVPYSLMLIPMFLGSIALGPRSLPWFVLASMTGVTCMIVAQPPTGTQGLLRVLVTFAIALLILVSSFRRSKLGIAGPRGESMLVELRDRLLAQGRIGVLPAAWYANSVLRSSGGTDFAGDFILANTSRPGELSLVIVDVSGKGVDAGSRSLLLSGAYGGLLTALPARDFLAAANEYLVRQNWTEGFATAIHLWVDLETGSFELRKAGHPPPVWLHAGSGKWSVLASEGPALGLIPDAEFECVRGAIQPGDGMMLFTDGLVEEPGRDIASGIDKLAGHGERMLATGFENVEIALVDQLERGDDDRALLIVHRRHR